MSVVVTCLHTYTFQKFSSICTSHGIYDNVCKTCVTDFCMNTYRLCWRPIMIQVTTTTYAPPLKLAKVYSSFFILLRTGKMYTFLIWKTQTVVHPSLRTSSSNCTRFILLEFIWLCLCNVSLKIFCFLVLLSLSLHEQYMFQRRGSKIRLKSNLCNLPISVIRLHASMILLFLTVCS